MIRSMAINIEDSVTIRSLSLEYAFQSVRGIASGLSKTALPWSEVVQIVKDIVYICKYSRIAFHEIARLTTLDMIKEAIFRIIDFLTGSTLSLN